VISATDVREATAACEKQNIRVAMIGHSLYPAEKRRIANAIKESCKVPVLQLHRGEDPELMQATYLHQSHTTDDFIEGLGEILRKKPNNYVLRRKRKPSSETRPLLNERGQDIG
jgi:hypothetical protein